MAETILITGSAGFLGQGLAQFCLPLGMTVVGVDVAPAAASTNCTAYYPLDLCEGNLGPILEQWQPQYLVHFAGNAVVGRSFTNPAADFQAGPQLFFKILDAVRQFSQQTRVLLSSSAAVYGQPENLPISEQATTRPISPYGYHKWLCELLAEEFTTIYGVRSASMRIFSAYGPGLRKQILWDLCCKCREQEQVRLSGSGNETRDFIHRDDICAAILCILTQGLLGGEVYNVASGVETSIRDLAKTVFRSYGLDEARLVFSGEERQGDPRSWRADISKLKTLRFSQSISFSQGIADYVSWFKKSQSV